MLELVLLSVQQQNVNDAGLAQDIEIIIADDGSASKTKDLIESFQKDFPFKLIHVWHPDNGFQLAAIRNLAVTKSSGEYLVFIDGDCVLPPDFLLQQMKLAEVGYFVAGNRVLLSQNYTQYMLKSKDINIAKSGVIGAIWHKLRGHINKFLATLRLTPTASWRKWRQHNWRYPKGCNIGVWRNDYFAVNGFDASFSGWGHEDSDFFVRLFHLGVFAKDGRFAVPVFHLWHPDAKRDNAGSNWQKFMQRVHDPKVIRAEIGIEQHA